MTTAEQRSAALGMVAALAECIRTLGSIPSGHLYTQAMGRMDIHGYNKIIGILKGAGLVEEKHHLLTWVGPKLEEK